MIPLEQLHQIITITAGSRHDNSLPEPPEGRKIQRIWTLRNEDLLREHGPEHNQSAFLEDNIHDYTIRNGKLRYYSRLSEQGQTVKLVLDYETSEERKKRIQERIKAHNLKRSKP